MVKTRRVGLPAIFQTVIALVAIVALAAPISAQDELVSQVAEAMDVSAEQARGAAGALFSVAQNELDDSEWEQVSGAVPGIDGLMSAAPRVETASAVERAAGGAALSSASSAFSELGIGADKVPAAVNAIGDYLSNSAGSEVADLFTGVFR